DIEAASIVAQRIGRISELAQHIADLVVGDRQIVPPCGGLRPGCSGRQTKPDVQAPAVPSERVRQGAPLIETVADFPVRVQETILPSQPRRPALDETLQQYTRLFGAV